MNSSAGSPVTTRDVGGTITFLTITFLTMATRHRGRARLPSMYHHELAFLAGRMSCSNLSTRTFMIPTSRSSVWHIVIIERRL